MKSFIIAIPSPLAAFILIAALILCLSAGSPAQIVTTAVRCGTLIDGRSERPAQNMVILISGNRINEIGRDVPIPSGAVVFDLSDQTVLPGFIDCHTHLLLHGGDYDEQLLKESQQYRAILSTVAALQTLRAGFTTVRDVETEGAMYGDVALRDAINRGYVPGPRIQASTRALSITGGYAPYGYSPDLTLPYGVQVADGVDGVRKAVREQIRNGADWIKIYADSRYHFRDADSLVGSPTFTDEELQAIVEEAEKVDVHVCAHTYTNEAARRAVRAGVKSIEHGLYLDDETFRLMKRNGVYWVPTLSAYVHTATDTTVSPDVRKRWIRTADRHRESFQRGMKSGVKIAFGTDMYDPHGSGGKEFALMAQYGMPPMKVIQSATHVAAELLGLEKQVGTIEAGKIADIVAVRGDPLRDMSLMESVDFVMKDGKVYRNDHATQGH